jgi:hypothetical protein
MDIGFMGITHATALPSAGPYYAQALPLGFTQTNDIKPHHNIQLFTNSKP